MLLNEAPLDTPFPLFESWFKQAKEKDPTYYCGMTVATVDTNGCPSSRVVFLRSFDDNGFIFYTNYHSDKGKDLAENPHICASFWWSAFQRQVRIEGQAEKISAKESDEYFYGRPHLSQIASAMSDQSRTIESFDVLQQKFDDEVERHKTDPVVRPEHWGGYRIVPKKIEFWQGLDHRLHHRQVYQQSEQGWQVSYLQP